MEKNDLELSIALSNTTFYETRFFRLSLLTEMQTGGRFLRFQTQEPSPCLKTVQYLNIAQLHLSFTVTKRF